MSSSEKQALPSGITIKNGRYYATPRIDGKRKWIGLTRESEGPKKLHEALQQLDVRPRPRTVADLLARFAAEGRGERAEATWPKYVQVCTYPTSKLLRFFGHMRIEAVRPTHVSQYLQHRLDEGYGPGANRDVAVLASAYDFGMRKGWADTRPTRGARRNPEHGSHVLISHEALQKHIDSLSPWIANFVAVLYLTGFRIGDLLALKWDQLGPKWMQVVEKKNKVLHFKEYSQILRHYLDNAKRHAEECSKRYKRPMSTHVFTGHYGKPLTYWGLRKAHTGNGNPFQLRQLRALAESTVPGSIGHHGLMKRRYTRTVRTKPVK
jgi:integrase